MNLASLPLILALAVAGGPGGDEHLLAGAGAFRDGRFDVALVEFRVAEKLGAPEAREYAAASLVKLGRPEEAFEAFASSPPGEDGLLDWYRALACYDARLYVCARRLLSDLGRAGPKAAAEAAKLHAEIARVLAPEPAAASIDWYLARCEKHGAERRPALATAYCREAAALGSRRPDRHGVARASAELAHLDAPDASGARR
ncbi:MAG TPA: hypothetical protein VIV57_02080 [Anaeromyxobacter sp.]